MDKSTYCPLPFIHIFSDSTNEYDICCHADNNASPSKELRAKWNVTKAHAFEFFDSPEMDKVRESMLNGERLASCHKCYAIEDTGAMSPRMSHLQKTASGWPRVKSKVDIKLRLFGSYCNLSCYMCSPNHSSGRRNDLKSLGYDLIDFQYHPEPIQRWTKLSMEQMENHLLENIDRISSMTVLGGEPLQVKRFYEFLEKIPDDAAKNVDLSISTNLTKIEFKGHTVHDIAAKFPNFALIVSADHYGEKESWIRWPIVFDEMVENLLELKDIVSIVVAPTVSVLNIEDYPNIFKFYNKLGVPIGSGSGQYVEDPDYLAPHLHPDAEGLIEMYRRSEFNGIALRMEADLKKETPETLEFKRSQMIHYLDKLATKRGDWRKIWKNF